MHREDQDATWTALGMLKRRRLSYQGAANFKLRTRYESRHAVRRERGGGADSDGSDSDSDVADRAG